MANGGVTFELTQESKRNLDLQMGRLKKLAPSAARKGMIKILFQIKSLAQEKLTYDWHIVTSRLKNSIYVQLNKPIETSENSTTYKDKDNKRFYSQLDVRLTEDEGAVGTNVEYAGKIEYQYDSYLYWGLKNVDLEKEWRKIRDELLWTIKQKHAVIRERELGNLTK